MTARESLQAHANISRNELGHLHFFLGIQVLKMDDGIFLSQPNCVMDLLKGFNLDDCKPCATPF